MAIRPLHEPLSPASRDSSHECEDLFVDRFLHEPCFAPFRETAQMEGSKAFAKVFMRRHSIPTAKYQHFTDFESAARYINDVSYNIIIKASDLAASRVVIFSKSKSEAILAVKELILDKKFGDSGSEVGCEEFLDGEELSILIVSDVVSRPAP